MSWYACIIRNVFIENQLDCFHCWIEMNYELEELDDVDLF